MSQRPEPWIVDPDDPRAPPLEIWEQLSSEQRARIVDSLPSEFGASEALPEAEELIAKLEGMLNQLEARLAEAEEAALQEARLRQEAERRLAEALREIEKLKQ